MMYILKQIITLNKFLSIEDGKINFLNKTGTLMGIASILNKAIGTFIVRNKILKNNTTFININALNEYGNIIGNSIHP